MTPHTVEPDPSSPAGGTTAPDGPLRDSSVQDLLAEAVPGKPIVVSTADPNGHVLHEADPDPGQVLVHRTEYVHQVTVADLLGWCRDRDLSPGQVIVTGTHLRWDSAQTDEEADAAARWERDKAARKEAWERETWERLKEKYQPDAPSPTTVEKLADVHGTPANPHRYDHDVCVNCGQNDPDALTLYRPRMRLDPRDLLDGQ